MLAYNWPVKLTFILFIIQISLFCPLPCYSPTDDDKLNGDRVELRGWEREVWLIPAQRGSLYAYIVPFS